MCLFYNYRERAIQYLQENTDAPLGFIGIDVDRYIAQPGRALAYYTGYVSTEAHASVGIYDSKLLSCHLI